MDHYGYTGDEKRDRRNRRELTTVSMYELKTHLDCLTEFHGVNFACSASARAGRCPFQPAPFGWLLAARTFSRPRLKKIAYPTRPSVISPRSSGETSSGRLRCSSASLDSLWVCIQP